MTLESMFRLTPCPLLTYHHISLLCLLLKVLESIIYKKIIDFIRPQLANQQFGFVWNHCCTSQLLCSFHNIMNSVDSKAACDVIYLDIRKAFDSIPYSELLFKLWTFGITGNLWHWCKDYLSNCSHFVCIDGHSSDLLPVRSGILQGSILGPLLFLVYIDNLPCSVSFRKIFLFADNAKLLKSISHDVSVSHLQRDLDTLTNWCLSWHYIDGVGLFFLSFSHFNVPLSVLL